MIYRDIIANHLETWYSPEILSFNSVYLLSGSYYNDGHVVNEVLFYIIVTAADVIGPFKIVRLGFDGLIYLGVTTIGQLQFATAQNGFYARLSLVKIK